MSQWLVMLITGTIGAIGFSIMFYMRPKWIWIAALGGFLSCGVYLLFANCLKSGEFLSNLVAALVTELFAQICARICHVPSTVFTLPSIVPLIPGGSLYKTMSAFVIKDYTSAATYGISTLSVTAAIAAGFALGYVSIYLIWPSWLHKRK